MAVASYSPETRNRGKVRLVKDLEADISGRHVLFVEDVIDTGLTLNYLLSNLRARQPASLEVCVLFDKPGKRLIDIPLKYKGLNLPAGLWWVTAWITTSITATCRLLARLKPALYEKKRSFLC